MQSNLNASKFKQKQQVNTRELEILLSKIVICYYFILRSNIILPNNENKIRDKLLDCYLKNDVIRNQIGLIDFHFEKEVPEEKGRVDIKVITKNTFIAFSSLTDIKIIYIFKISIYIF